MAGKPERQEHEQHQQHAVFLAQKQRHHVAQRHDGQHIGDQAQEHVQRLIAAEPGLTGPGVYIQPAQASRIPGIAFFYPVQHGRVFRHSGLDLGLQQPICLVNQRKL